MAIACYLAMTASEIASTPALPHHLAYMACHFSPYSTGLSNLPVQLPPGAILLLTDRTPIHRHDPEHILQQLSDTVTACRCSSLLLDLQRPGSLETACLARFLAERLPCPVVVSHHYAEALDAPVFLPPVPPDISLQEYLEPWQGREIWLEAALEGIRITLTQTGSQLGPAPPEDLPLPHIDSQLHCHYRIDATPDSASFTLRRTPEDLSALLAEAETLGVTQAVGLYQELGNFRIT